MPKGLQGFQKGELNPSCRVESRQKLSERMTGKKMPERQKKKNSESMKKLLQDPEVKKKWHKFPTGDLNPNRDPKVLKKRALSLAKKPKKKSTLIRKLDRVFSSFIRNKDSVNGMNQCITCRRWLPISGLDCGHYVSRIHHSLRFDERNVAPQCVSCNRYHEGRKDEFALALIKKYGDSILTDLNNLKQETKQFTRSELEEKYQYYNSKLK